MLLDKVVKVVFIASHTKQDIRQTSMIQIQ